MAAEVRAFRSRNERLVEGVRMRMSRNERTLGRLRRPERMEPVARVWVNGRAVGGERHPQLAASHD